MQLQTLQYLINLQAKERERERERKRGSRKKVRWGEREKERERERGSYHKLPSSKDSRLTPAGLATESTLHWPGNWINL